MQRDFAAMPAQLATKRTPGGPRENYVACLTNRLRWENDAGFFWDVTGPNADGTWKEIREAHMDEHWLLTLTAFTLTFTNLETHDCVVRRSLTRLHSAQFVAPGVVVVITSATNDNLQLEAFELDLERCTERALHWRTRHYSLNQLCTAMNERFVLLYWGRQKGRQADSGAANTTPNIGVVDQLNGDIQYLQLEAKTRVGPIDGPADITALCLVPDKDLAIAALGKDAEPYEIVLLKLSTLETTSRMVGSLLRLSSLLPGTFR